MKRLREEGYPIVIRSAGSRSPIDIIGIDPNLRRIVLIQCKSGKSSKTQIKRTKVTIGELLDIRLSTLNESEWLFYSVKVKVV